MRGNRSVEAKRMKITIIGALEIAAVVLTIVFLIERSRKQQNPGSQPSGADGGS